MAPISEEELLAASAASLAGLTTDLSNGAIQRVCHHFFPLDGAAEDAYLPELPARIAEIDPAGLIDVIGDPVGVEVWDLRAPATGWLGPLIRAYHDAAVSCSAVYAGWSYEPDDRSRAIN